MSTRKSTAAAVAASKSDNVATDTENSLIVTTTTPTTPKPTSSSALAEPSSNSTSPSNSVENSEGMGANTSANSFNGDKTDSDKESSQKEKEKGTESKRVTRNSPMLCVSPTTKKEAVTETEKSNANNNMNIENEESETTRKANTPIRARKSIKDSGKDANDKDTIVKLEHENESDDKERNEGKPNEPNNEEEKETTHKSQQTEDKDAKLLKEGDNEFSNPLKEVKLKDLTTNTTTNITTTAATTATATTSTPTAATTTTPTVEIAITTTISTTSTSSSTVTTTTPASSSSSSILSHNTSPPSTTNRLTRKALADEVASKTRMTRNRQASAGSATRPETPPSNASNRGRHRLSAGARRANEGAISSASVQKRKRSVEDPSDPSTIAAKFIKTEPKEDEDSDTIIATSHEMVKVKQEVMENDDAHSLDTTQGSAAATSQTNSAGRTRNLRWPARKSNQTISPSTRSTRQSKVASPSPAAASEPKRRRTAGSKGAYGKQVSASTSSVADEDSKDSMASSSVDEGSSLLLSEIKTEKVTTEEVMESGITGKSDKIADVNSVANPIEEPQSSETMEGKSKAGTTSLTADKISHPLVVCTETEIKDTEMTSNADTVDPPITPEADTGTTLLTSNIDSDKDEMVSEGVSETSVTQFYKKPKFLENNLGIEEDPKLGEIVQKATTEIDIAAPSPSELSADQVEKTEKFKESVTATVSSDSSTKSDSQIDTLSIDNSPQTTDDSKKAKVEFSNLSASSLSPLIMEDDTDVDEQMEVITDQKSNLTASEAKPEECEKTEASALSNYMLVEKFKADLDDEDDTTIAESETVSMENNPSVEDDLPDDDNYEKGFRLDGNLESNRSVVENVSDATAGKVQESEGEQDQRDIKGKEIIECQGDQKEEIDITKTEVSSKTNSSDCNKKVQACSESSVATENLPEKNSENLKLLIKLGTVVKNLDKDSQEDLKEIEACNDDVKKQEPQTQLKDDDKVKCAPIESRKEAKMEVDEDDTKLREGDAIDELKNNKKIGDQTETKPQVNLEIETAKSLGTVSDATNSSDCTEFGNKENEVAKEQLLQNLGLLTLKAAEKQRQENIKNSVAAHEASRVQQQPQTQQYSKRHSKTSTTAAPTATSHEYTGTLKTVIKLNRSGSNQATSSTSMSSSSPSFTASLSSSASAATPHSGGNRKSNQTQVNSSALSASVVSGKDGVRRQSLKITFQKGRGRGGGHSSDRNGGNNNDAHDPVEDAYYTIQNENEGLPKSHFNNINSSNNSNNNNINSNNNNKNANVMENQSNYSNSVSSSAHGSRKSYCNRSNTNSANNTTNSASNVDSSHSDETNSHGITSHKKDEKEEILIPEKASSFKFHPGRLCEDQCYYCSGKFGLYDTPCHVGQIKSVERQQKILQNEEKLTVDNCLCDACFRHVDRRANVPSYRKRLSASGYLETIPDPSEEGNAANGSEEAEATGTRKCVIPECDNPASHSLRRKCIRKTVKKLLLNFDIPAGSTYIWLCQSHYNTVIQCSGCVLCKRRLGKNHMYHITSDTERLEKALADLGIPVQLGMGTAVCKLCRYFANLLMKPLDSTKSQKAEFVQNYRKRLLKFHNIHDGSNEASEADEEDSNSGMSVDPNKTEKAEKDSFSPAASTTSSVVCINEESTDKTSIQTDTYQKDEDMDFEMSSAADAQHSGANSPNTNSKSPTPIASVKHISKLKAILQGGKNQTTSTNSTDISSVLRSNPNISMRELFPGEEDLGLSFKADFGGSGSHRTPEGWTRVQTFLQYDEPTRRLWEELQKPYGNQSSFLRHLILLEKYFRNGDLMLAPHASSNASVYTQTVRQRITSFDDGQCPVFLQSSSNSKTINSNAISNDIATKQSDRTSTDNMDIPTVEIPEDDDDVIHNEDGDSSDSVQAVPLMDNGNSNSSINSNSGRNLNESTKKEKPTRTSSVDKLAKQLNTNAVTIIAKPKETNSPSNNLNNNNSQQQKHRSLLKDKDTNPQSNAKSGLSNLSVGSSNANSMVNQNLSSSAPNASVTLNSSSSSSSNSRSVLKSNLLGGINKSVEILPVSSSNNSVNNQNQPSRLTFENAMQNNSILFPPTGGIGGVGTSGNGNSKQSKILEMANKLQAAAASASANSNKQGRSSLPSQSQSQSQSQVQTQPQNLSHQSQAASSLFDLVNMQRRSLPSTSNNHSNNNANTASNANTANSSMNPKKGQLVHKNRSAPLVILPDTLSSQERAESKTWRPTLLPISEHQHLQNKDGPIYQTADGRRLPSLVQVQSGGKPFLISIFDYNRMCILRREKLLRDQMLKSSKNRGNDNKSSQQQQSQLSKGGSNLSSQIPSGSSGSNKSLNPTSKQQQAAAQLLQLQLQCQKQQQQQQQQALKYGASGAMGLTNNLLNNPNNRFPSKTATSSMTATSSPSSMLNSVGLASNSTSGSSNSRLSSANPFSMPLLANPSALAALSSNPWLWNHFPDANELLRNSSTPTTKMPPLMPIPSVTASGMASASNVSGSGTASTASNLVGGLSSGGNSSNASSIEKQLQQQFLLMSKIPKSLTVIPQHKLMGINTNTGNGGNGKRD